MIKKNIELLTFLAIILGILFGFLIPEYAVYFKFLGSIFLSLLKVLIIPIIILSLFLAITQVSSFDSLKKLGLKTILYYFSTTAIAVLTAITLANFFIFNNNKIQEQQKELINTDINFVKHIFPTNIFESLAKGEILHIVVFTLLFSLAFLKLPKEVKQKAINSTKVFYEVFLTLINWVILLAPLGVLCLVWNTIANLNYSTLNNLSSFFIATLLASLIHSCISLPLIGKFFGNFNAFKYFVKVKEAIMIALATASSSASLPVSIKVSEKAKVHPKVAQFVLPIGATLNMDGSALYQSLLILLFASLSGIDLSLADQLLLFICIALSSAGTAGVPSGGIIMVTLMLNLFKIPNIEHYIGIYIMVDRFWDYPITSINVWSDLIGAKTINHHIKL